MIKFYVLKNDSDLITKVYNSYDEAKYDEGYDTHVDEVDLVDILNELLGRMANK